MKACPLIYIDGCCANCCDCAMTVAPMFYIGIFTLAVEGLTVVSLFVLSLFFLVAARCYCITVRCLPQERWISKKEYDEPERIAKQISDILSSSPCIELAFRSNGDVSAWRHVFRDVARATACCRDTTDSGCRRPSSCSGCHLHGFVGFQDSATHRADSVAVVVLCMTGVLTAMCGWHGSLPSCTVCLPRGGAGIKDVVADSEQTLIACLSASRQTTLLPVVQTSVHAATWGTKLEHDAMWQWCCNAK